MASVARPRSGSQGLTLVLVLLAVGTAGALVVHALLHHRLPGSDLFAVTPILLGALVARTSPWWRAELQGMTADRARNGAGSVILLLDALVLAVHLLSNDLGWKSDYVLLGPFSSTPAAPIVLVLAAVLAFAIILNLPVLNWLGVIGHRSGEFAGALREPRVVSTVTVDELPRFFQEVSLEETVDASPVARQPAPPKPSRATSPGEPQAGIPVPGPLLPPIETFAPPARGKVAAVDLSGVGTRIEETLASFGVRAKVVAYHQGPVVTQFDVQPDRGVKVKSITSLQNDLALALAAPTIRIQAPVPGKPVVGIEIPNATATVVSLRELLDTDAFRSVKSPLAVVLGKDVAGAPAIIDLARMPHLLVAGATGSGKSVCINALISCLLYRNTPEDVRLMMIDPKMVELTVYNGVPHLLSPVVTDMDKVVGVLQWALREMERRYKLFADNTVRNIGRYNEKLEADGRQKLPYIVLIIDELADLMMVAPEDVEDAVCRLAQLARAAGIHLVIATQRPSVDVITGLIKANFPARIAFAMTSQVDSRTILDTAGAEKLLGRGDMLYMPPDAPKSVRLQGAFLSDVEIEKLVEFWQRSPLQEAIQRIAAEEFVAAEKEAAAEGDELLPEAIRTVSQFQTASVTLLQRQLRVGYVRAARIMAELEERGIVGAPDGSKQRAVLKGSDDDSA